MLAVVQSIPEQASVFGPSAIIPSDHAEALEMYYRVGGIGGAFSASNMAIQLARAERYAFHARPCLRCGGDRKRWNPGSGFVCSSIEKRQRAKQHADRLALLGIDIDPPAGDKLCPKCNGKGWVVPKRMTRSKSTRRLTARPTGSSKHGIGPSASVECQGMALLGALSRRIEQLFRSSPRASDGLESWFTIPKNQGGRTIRSLWHMVPAGKTMLRQNGQKLLPWEFFDNERAAQHAKPNATRQLQFEAADAQAVDLWSEICRLWNALGVLQLPTARRPKLALASVQRLPVLPPPRLPDCAPHLTERGCIGCMARHAQQEGDRTSCPHRDQQ